MKRCFLIFGTFCVIAMLLIGCGVPAASPPSTPSVPPPTTEEIIIKYSSTTIDQIGK